MRQHVDRAASRNRLVRGLKYVRLHTDRVTDTRHSNGKYGCNMNARLRVALFYFIPRIKHGPLTAGARRKIIALPEVRQNGFNEGSTTFISRGAYCVLIGGKLRGKSITTRNDFRIRRWTFFLRRRFINSRSNRILFQMCIFEE